jgi:hypothetical protein
MDYRRCGDSAFYWEVGSKMAGRAYVDPVDMVWVTSIRLERSWLLSRVVIELFEPNEVFFNFADRQAAMLLRWRLRVMDAKANGKGDWKDHLLADLDVDLSERDELLRLLVLFIMEAVVDENGTAVRKTLEVPPTTEAMNDALRHFGVPLCL